MECEVCGRNAPLAKAKIEGIVLSVCQNCAPLGRMVEIRAHVPDKRRIRIDTKTINPDFAKIVRAARISSVLTIEQLGEKIGERANVIERVEKGMRPTDELAKKLEKALSIRLFGIEEVEVETHKKKDALQSLGDVAVIRHKKK